VHQATRRQDTAQGTPPGNERDSDFLHDISIYAPRLQSAPLWGIEQACRRDERPS
jgi:hypothetical protein